MTEDSRRLNIVNKEGEIIGEDTREKIHNEGLLHKEVHVWFYTPQGEILFQHRGKAQETFPDLLDATVGGHVEIGDDYEISALKEMEEETGVKSYMSALAFIQTTRTKRHDDITNKTNNALRAVYAYRYDGDIESLRVEEGKALGFEAWPIDKILNATEEDKKRFVPSIFDGEIQGIFKKIKELV